MDLTFWITLVSLAVCNGVPPGGPTFMPVFVSPHTLNHLNEKDKAINGNIGNQHNKNNSDHDALINQRSVQNDFDIRKDNQVGYNAPPVYELQDHGGNDMHQAQAQYQQSHVQPQYQQPQQYMIQQPPQNPIQQQPYQIIQQPGKIQQPYQISTQQTQQPILLAEIPQANPQPIYANQQMGPLQVQQPISNQPILLNQQQYPNQPVQTFQQPNQQTLLISQPMIQPIGQPIMGQGNGQILLSQPLQNQQPILLQPSQNPQPLIAPNILNPGFSPSNQLQPNQNGNVYAVIPVNNQNVHIPNQNTNTYLVPVQQLPNQVYAVNAG